MAIYIVVFMYKTIRNENFLAVFFLTRADWPLGIGVIPLDLSSPRQKRLFSRTVCRQKFTQKFSIIYEGWLVLPMVPSVAENFPM